MSKQVLDVLYQCDDNYATLTGVSMVSLLENNKDLEEIHIHLLDDGIHEANRAKLREAVASYGRKLTIVDTGQIRQRLIDLKVEPYKNTYTTYYKILAIRQLETDSDRILYLDGDTIINGSLQPLLDIDLGETVMGAAYECILNDYKEIIGMRPNDTYYNCGVMLINRRVWIEQDCDTQILEHFLNVRSRYFIVDQDVINVLFHNNVTLIDPSYNFNAGFYIYGVHPSYRIYNLTENFYFPESIIEHTLNNGPIINHCMGGFTGRPWEANNIHPQGAAYDRYLHISPWKNDPKMVRTLSRTLKLQRFLYKVLPMSLYWRIHRQVLHRYYITNNRKIQATENQDKA